jgi:hypothetical protein
MVENRGIRMLILLSFVILLSNFASAILDESTTTQLNPNSNAGLTIVYPKYEYVQQNNSFNLTIHVHNNSNGANVTTATCFLQVKDSTGQVGLFSQLISTTNGYNLFIQSGNFTRAGISSFYIPCYVGTDLGGFADGVFFVTPLGDELTTPKAILYSFLIFIFLLLNFTLFYVIACLNPGNYYKEGSTGEIYAAKSGKSEMDEAVGISIKKYLRILLIALSYPTIILTLNLMLAAANNLTLPQFAGIISNLFSTMMRAAWAWVIVIIIWVVRTVWKDGNFIDDIKNTLEEAERNR